MILGSGAYLSQLSVWSIGGAILEGLALSLGWAIYEKRNLRVAAARDCHALHVLFGLCASAPLVTAVAIHWLIRHSQLPGYEGAVHQLRPLAGLNIRQGVHEAYEHFALCLLVWLCVASLLVVRLVRAWLVLRKVRYIRAPDNLQDAMDNVAETLALKRIPTVVLSAHQWPFVIGTKEPRVFIPKMLFAKLSKDHLNAVLSHEAVHVAHNDFAWNLIQRSCIAIFWWNPGLWLLYRRIQRQREFLCDEIATWCTSPSTLARALLVLAETQMGVPAGLGLSVMSGNLTARVTRIYSYSESLTGYPLQQYIVPSALLLITMSIMGIETTKDASLKRAFVMSDFGPLITIDAHDDRGKFKVEMRGGHVISVALDSHPRSETEISQRGDQVLVKDRTGKDLLDLNVDPGGRVTWQPRKKTSE